MLKFHGLLLYSEWERVLALESLLFGSQMTVPKTNKNNDGNEGLVFRPNWRGFKWEHREGMHIYIWEPQCRIPMDKCLLCTHVLISMNCVVRIKQLFIIMLGFLDSITHSKTHV